MGKLHMFFNLVKVKLLGKPQLGGVRFVLIFNKEKRKRPSITKSFPTGYHCAPTPSIQIFYGSNPAPPKVFT
jgi:hypothetical protein